MVTVKVIEARARFSELLNRVARGEKIMINRYGVPVAMLIPVDREESKSTHAEIVQGMRALRKRVRPGKVSVREMAAEGRRF